MDNSRAQINTGGEDNDTVTCNFNRGTITKTDGRTHLPKRRALNSRGVTHGCRALLEANPEGKGPVPVPSIHGRDKVTHLRLSLTAGRVRKLVSTSVKFLDT